MPPTDPALTPAQERAVRDLLSGARHDEPLPDDVAARLDHTLAGLVSERAGDRVVTLRSRRRKLSAGLVAAAAVVVIGVVGGQVVGGRMAAPSSQTEAGGSDSSSVERRDGPGEATDEAGEAARSSPEAGADQQHSTRDAEADVRQQAVPSIDPRSFAADSRVARRAANVSLLGATTPGCRAPAGPGLRVAVRYAGHRAVLVFDPPRDDRQKVGLYLCGDTAPRRTAVLPAR